MGTALIHMHSSNIVHICGKVILSCGIGFVCEKVFVLMESFICEMFLYKACRAFEIRLEHGLGYTNLVLAKECWD